MQLMLYRRSHFHAGICLGVVARVVGKGRYDTRQCRRIVVDNSVVLGCCGIKLGYMYSLVTEAVVGVLCGARNDGGGYF